MKKIDLFMGSLSLRKKLPKAVAKAYCTYKNQVSRCTNPKVRSYRDYGAKGIRVEYTAREFVAWYLENIKKFNGKKPTVGRIDHSKNYTLHNIEIQSASANSSEAMARTSHKFSYPVLVYERLTGKFVGRFKSMKSASDACGNSFSHVQRICSGAVKNPKTKYIYILEDQKCAA